VSFYGDKNKVISDAALEQWKTDGTGPWSKYACELGVGYFKLGEKFTSSPEFLALPASEQAYLNHETVPHYEVITHFPIHWFQPGFPEEDLDAACLLTFLYNSQAKGTAELQSSDPNVPLLFDPKFLEHEFDRRVATDSLREVLRLVESPAFAKDTVGTLFAPAANATDDELLEYWQQTIGSSWHPLGTVKMGKRGDADAAVDKDFRIFETEGLRVADMSVVPVLPSCHTQSVACK
jgi:choline dehydrogenase-like flavoprotein